MSTNILNQHFSELCKTARLARYKPLCIPDFTLIAEVDDCGYGGWRKPGWVNEPLMLLDWIIVHVRSIQNQYPQIGVCSIRRSGNGYHMIFPRCIVHGVGEFEKMLQLLPHDVGWANWSCHYHGKATLRIGEKPIVKVVGNEFSRQLGIRVGREKSQTIRMVFPDGTILSRAEIESRYGDAV